MRTILGFLRIGLTVVGARSRLRAADTLRRRARASLILLLLLVVLPVAAQAQYIYTKNDDGTITITAYTGPGGDVTIPSTIDGLSVTIIGPYAFANNTNLTSIILPASVTAAHEAAFADCTALRSVTLGQGFKELWFGPCCYDYYQFYGCISLTNFTVDPLNPLLSSRNGVLFNKSQDTMYAYPQGRSGSFVMPDTVVQIFSPRAFRNCTGLTSVSIGSSLYSPPNFFGCTALTNISVNPLNPNYYSLDGVLFDRYENALILYPQARLGAYSLPGTVTSIYDSAFADCRGLTSMSIGSGVIRIGDWAFAGCTSLTGMTIGNGVTYIGDSAFWACTELRNVFFAGNTPSNETNAFVSSTNATIYYLPGSTGWGSAFAGRPAALWNPQVQVGDGGFSVRANGFGFNIVGTPNIPIVVEASTHFVSGAWVPLQTITLTNGLVSFSDPAWTNYSARFYRLRSP